MVSASAVPWERLNDLPTPLSVIATAFDDLTPHVLSPVTVPDWKLAFRATAAIPLLAGKPVELQGRRWIDGSVSEPLPIPRALADGATHVLAFVNRSVPELRRADPGADPGRWTAALDRLAPGLGSIASQAHRLAPVLKVIESVGHPSRQGRHLLVIAPQLDAGVRGLTTDPLRVQRAAEIGYATLASTIARIIGDG